MAKTKDIPRHAARLDERAQGLADRQAGLDRFASIQAMKDAWVASRSGDPQAAINTPQQQTLLRIMAAELGLIDPD